MKVYNCAICGKDISFNRMKYHLAEHGITAERYYTQYLNNGNIGICKACGKPTQFINLSTGYKTCCNKSCSIKYGHLLRPDLRYAAVETLKKFTQDKEFQSKSGKKGYLRQQELYPDWRKNTRATIKERHPNLFHDLGKLTGPANIRAFNKFRKEHEGCGPYEWILWSDPRFRVLNPQRQDYRFRSSYKMIMDFSIERVKIRVEIDGHSHECPEIDKRNDEKILKIGWKTLRFTNEEVKNNTSYVIDCILEEAKNRGFYAI